ncbi:Centrosomal protein C10orf90 [Merluccius polli]|uniref:Centrosomal protein C10orf90 n=1 Tax=Merluccius polli TaxID=89951 RepID=A0AA47NC05_MERPO|nr:Centrosomal protein C10orf90 [Merluccius polli]
MSVRLSLQKLNKAHLGFWATVGLCSTLGSKRPSPCFLGDCGVVLDAWQHRPSQCFRLSVWQEALERSRPAFVARSQDRVREMQRRAQERRRRKLLADSGGSADPRSGARPGRTRSQQSPLPSSVKDNLCRRRDGAITGRDMDPRSRRSPGVGSEGKRTRREETRREETKREETKREETKREETQREETKREETQREARLTNRQPAEIFRKRLLDQILQRNDH